MQKQLHSDSNLHHFPQVTAHFVGREAELTDLQAMFGEPACRLITIIGPGGMGKTRLAQRVAELSVSQFADGCYWVDLQPLQSPDQLLQSLVDALNIMVSSSPLEQLANYLRPKQLLLVLDNFEHLLEGAPLLASLLSTAPKVKMLVTSREALNLREEWVHYLEGLPFPTSEENAGTVDDYPAVRLFADSARRASSTFDLENSRPSIIRICQHVAGMPLALELAAAWTRSLSCGEIADEIQNGLDLFTARSRNIPERHRSIRVVFDRTCDMLSAEEIAVLQQLSVFRGGFTREAAEQVTGATLPILTTLIDKSLVKLSTAGRYHMHELLRQYASELLSQSPGDFEGTTRRHCAYFAKFLRGQEEYLYGGGQREAAADIRAELDNIRSAWRWACKQSDTDPLQDMASSVAQFCLITSREAEMAEFFSTALEHFQTVDHSSHQSTVAFLFVCQSVALARLGQIERAEASAWASMEIYDRIGIEYMPVHGVHPKMMICILESLRGRHEAAVQAGQEAREVSEAIGHNFSYKWACYALAAAALDAGQLDLAQESIQQIHAAAVAYQEQHFATMTTTLLGHIAFARDDLDEAERYYLRNVERHNLAVDHLWNTAVSLKNLGDIALRRGKATTALDYYEQSRVLSERLFTVGEIILALQGCAQSKIRLGRYASAWQDLLEAVQLARELQFIPYIIGVLVDMAELFFLLERVEEGGHILSAVCNNPAMLLKTRKRLDELIARYHLDWPPDTAEHEPLDALLASLPGELPDDGVKQPPQPATIPKFKQDLIEPLTEREQEVLHYVAQGLSNREIAETMFVSLSTVKSHINNLYGKLGVSERGEAVNRARDLNLL